MTVSPARFQLNYNVGTLIVSLSHLKIGKIANLKLYNKFEFKKTGGAEVV